MKSTMYDIEVLVLYGYVGKLLRVDLTKEKIIVENLNEKYARNFIGGAGLAARILYNEVKPEVDALSPNNRLVFMTGPLVGTDSPSCGRFVVAAKSPLTGIWGEAGSAGFWGPELKFAGYDGIIIQGKAEYPVYLWIKNEYVELKDAKEIWGKDTYETEDLLRNELRDDRVKVACIGPAGEKLIRIAAVINDRGRAAARCGLGAVMGSKNMKAVAVRGTRKIEVADEEALKRVVGELKEKMKVNPVVKSLRAYGTAGGMESAELQGDVPIKNWTLGTWSEGASKVSGQAMEKTILKRASACYACPIGCRREVEILSGEYAGVRGEGPEYETCAAFGLLCLNDNLESIAKMNELCNRYGIDTISCGSMISFAMECFEKGILTREDTGGLDLRFGNPKAMIEVIKHIATREGLGDILAEGVKRAAEVIDKGVKAFAMHVKAMELPMHDPRAFESVALGYATSNRGACHSQAQSHWVERGSLFPEFGIDTKLDRFTTGGKAEMVIKMQNFMAVLDSLVMCKFILLCGLRPTHIVELYSAVTGWDMSLAELQRIGERIYNIKRAFNVRIGISRKDDTLPERILKESLIKGGTKGHVPSLELMLPEYYSLRGWDETGKPTKAKLEELGLDDIVKYLLG